MLSKDEKKYLRSLANELPSQIQIGKGGLSQGLFQTIDTDLNAHELIKVTLLKTCDVDVRQAALDCAGATHSQVIHIIGRTFVLYRKSRKNKLEIKG